jgi:metacaspase-1
MRRKALIIGINYTGSSHELRGCVNDAMNIQKFLVREHNFSPNPADMVVLTDIPRNRGTPYEPTGANMMSAFRWLVTGNHPGDSVWLSYSGHGGMKLRCGQRSDRQLLHNVGQVKDPDADRDSGSYGSSNEH